MAIFSYIHLGLKNAGVKTGLARTKQDISRFTGDIKRAVAGVALGGGLLVTLRQAAREYDKIAKTASKLGVSGEFVQRLAFASEKAGLGANNAQLALQRFVRRIAEAKDGTGEALKATRELGIEFEDQDGRLKSNERLFREVADALAAVENQGDRVRLAFKFFDSEGVGLVNAFANGFRDIEEASKDLTLVSDKDLKNIEAANDAFTSIRTNIVALVGGLLGKLVGYFKEINVAIDKMEAAEAGKNAQSSFFNQALRDAQAVEKVEDKWEAVNAQVIRARAARDLASQQFKDRRFNFFHELLGTSDSALSDLRRAQSELETLVQLRERVQAGEELPAVNPLGRQEALKAEKERAAAEALADRLANTGNTSAAGGITRLLELVSVAQKASETVGAEADLQKDLAEIRANAARDALQAEERLLALRRRQWELQQNFAAMDADDRKEAAEEIKNLEREKIAAADELRAKREQAAEAVARLEKEAERMRFAGGIDRVRSIGGTLGGTTVRLEAPKEAQQELKVARDQLSRLDQILEKIPENLAVPGVSFRGGTT